MKTLKITLAAVLILAVGASAQLPSKPFNIYIGGGVTLPNQPDGFKDRNNLGYHGMAGLGLNVFPKIQLVGKLGYYDLSLDKDKYGNVEDVTGVDGGDFTAFTYGADLKLAIGVPMMSVKPFVFGGIGMANLGVSEISFDMDKVPEWNASKIYYNFGGGLEFKYGPGLTFFVQATYLSISGDKDPKSLGETDNRIVMIPVSLGLKF
ncbi:MAG: outer membrane beta-barrel protein [candidate division Zixibacteria bacterium]|nr:outer membrane beta-barrel protein [candidate division Zixibacteria bacterium]